MQSIYDITMQDIKGNDVSLGDFRGRVMLIVNVASQCGYTHHYEGLQELFEEYRDRGFTILGFPSNDFGEQEPGSNEEIREFCTTQYGVTFPMFAKIKILGDEGSPLYKLLASSETEPIHAEEIRWNFVKFLVDREGNIVKRFGHRMPPESREIREAIEELLSRETVPS